MYGDYDRFYQNYVPAAVNPATGLVPLSAYNNQTRRRNLFNQTDVIYNASTGDIKHTLLSGFELGRQHSNNFRQTGFFNNTATSISVPFDDPVISTPITFRQIASDADNRGIGPGPLQSGPYRTFTFVHVVAGVRFDYSI